MKRKEFVQKLVEAVVPQLTLGGSYGLSYDLFYKDEMKLEKRHRHYPATLWIDTLKDGRVSIKLKPHTFWTDQACLECVNNLKQFASEMGLKNVTVKPYYTATYPKRWAVKLICDKPWNNEKVIDEEKTPEVEKPVTENRKNYPIWVMGVCVGYCEI